jgi:NIPSNAP
VNRRNAIKGGLAAGLTGMVDSNTMGSQRTSSNNHFYELRIYELRSDLKPGRMQDFLKDHFMPAMKRAGAGPIGCFSVISGLQSPAFVIVIDYASLAAMQTTIDKIAEDKVFIDAARAMETTELPYVRYESALLKAFDAHPKLEVPVTDAQRALRVFELRTYQSPNAFGLKAKLAMFNQEEIKIFRNCGFAPVFFGEALFATRMPHLTYMVGFDNMGEREKAWDKFRVDPDWQRIRTKPGWTDVESVSNIHAAFLRPTTFSEVK